MDEGSRIMDILMREYNVFITQSAVVADLVKKVGNEERGSTEV